MTDYVSSNSSEDSRQWDERGFAFWIYLMSDAVIFALLFATFAVMASNTNGGPGGKQLFELRHTFIETMLLLTSSMTFGFASVSVSARNKAATLAWLAVTFALGLGFIGMEISEFHGMIAQGAGPDRSGFLSAFFTLVGTHGLHVGSGLVWIIMIGVETAVCGLTPRVVSHLYRLGLFWHFLDIIWIAIFSFVYLRGIV